MCFLIPILELWVLLLLLSSSVCATSSYDVFSFLLILVTFVVNLLSCSWISSPEEWETHIIMNLFQCTSFQGARSFAEPASTGSWARWFPKGVRRLGSAAVMGSCHISNVDSMLNRWLHMELNVEYHELNMELTRNQYGQHIKIYEDWLSPSRQEDSTEVRPCLGMHSQIFTIFLNVITCAINERFWNSVLKKLFKSKHASFRWPLNLSALRYPIKSKWKTNEKQMTISNTVVKPCQL